MSLHKYYISFVRLNYVFPEREPYEHKREMHCAMHIFVPSCHSLVFMRTILIHFFIY